MGAGVPVQPGPSFGAPGCFRIQFGATDETLGRALDRVRDIDKEL
jgi:bifunctional pyridoxal-dependent enzyme with beta-cystathionase and maltose regulon repressor activities